MNRTLSAAEKVYLSLGFFSFWFWLGLVDRCLHARVTLTRPNDERYTDDYTQDSAPLVRSQA
jgi:hypothetical protein